MPRIHPWPELPVLRLREVDCDPTFDRAGGVLRGVLFGVRDFSCQGILVNSIGDAMICHICEIPIPKRRSHKRDIQGNCRDPLAYTRDHVIPKSKGGKHLSDNTRPAHRICNERKGPHAELSIYFVRDIQKHVLKLLADSGRATSEDLEIGRLATERTARNISILRYDNRPVGRDLARWADDGGMVMCA